MASRQLSHKVEAGLLRVGHNSCSWGVKDQLRAAREWGRGPQMSC